MEYAFHLYNKWATDGLTMATERILSACKTSKNTKTKGAGLRSMKNPPSDLPPDPPVVVCVGSDLAIGDSLGPITGSMLKFKTQGLRFSLYGTLASPVTAKEIRYLRAFLKDTHPNSKVLAIDAAVGEKGDIGLIKANDSPLFPGAGANKTLGALGDMSILGVVAEKSVSNYTLLNTTRLQLVYSMAEIISDAVANLLWESCNPNRKNA